MLDFVTTSSYVYPTGFPHGGKYFLFPQNKGGGANRHRNKGSGREKMGGWDGDHTLSFEIKQCKFETTPCCLE
jgi:hypothetical protein